MRTFRLALILAIAASRSAAGDGVTDFIIDPATGRTITQSGSYRLAADVQMTDDNAIAIRIQAPDVTIDLNGHTIRDGSGIRADSALSARTVLRNGRVLSSAAEGVVLPDPGARIEDVTVEGCSATGIYLGENAQAVRCVSRNNVSPASSSAYCAGLRAGSGALIVECSVSGNTGGSGANSAGTGGNGGAAYGIFAGDDSIIRRCTATGATGGAGGNGSGLGSTGGSGGHGIGIQSGGRSLVVECVVSANQGGVLGAGLPNFGASGIAYGIEAGSGAVIRGCTVSNHLSGVGINANASNGGVLIEDNRIDYNAESGQQGTGIFVGGTSCVIRRNVILRNIAVPIQVDGTNNRIETNLIRSTGTNQIAPGNSVGALDLGNLSF